MGGSCEARRRRGACCGRGAALHQRPSPDRTRHLPCHAVLHWSRRRRGGGGDPIPCCRREQKLPKPGCGGGTRQVSGPWRCRFRFPSPHQPVNRDRGATKPTGGVALSCAVAAPARGPLQRGVPSLQGPQPQPGDHPTNPPLRLSWPGWASAASRPALRTGRLPVASARAGEEGQRGGWSAKGEARCESAPPTYGRKHARHHPEATGGVRRTGSGGVRDAHAEGPGHNDWPLCGGRAGRGAGGWVWRRDGVTAIPLGERMGSSRRKKAHAQGCGGGVHAARGRGGVAPCPPPRQLARDAWRGFASGGASGIPARRGGRARRSQRTCETEKG